MWTHNLLAASVALALAGPAVAQTSPMSPPAPDTSGISPAPSRGSDDAASPPSRSSDASNRATGPASAKFLTTQKDDEHISSDLVGIAVVNNAGENVGKISNLLIGPDNRISGAVLSVGGFLGLGAKSVAVPWDAIKIEPKDSKRVAVIAMSSDEIVNAPDFKTQAQMKAEAEMPRSRAPGSPALPMTPSNRSQ